MTIPPRAHFCWIGTGLPWAYVFAILSAAERSGLAEIILHHTDALADGAGLRALQAAPGVRLSRCDPLACLDEAGHRLGVGGALAGLYGRLAAPTSQADVLRAAILYLHGGVYLDLDTVTIASLLPLLQMRHFVGSEFIVWPAKVRASRSPLVWARHLGLDLARKVMRGMPGGWKAFRRVQRCYVRGVNNAVMGMEAAAPLISDYLRAMPALAPGRQGQAYALGPDLLQEMVDRYQGNDLAVQPPEVFYPLPPEISEHWFRIGRGCDLDAVLSGATRVVHWYASVRGKARLDAIDPLYVREYRDRQLYSALVWSCVGVLPDLCANANGRPRPTAPGGAGRRASA
jgi:hypothetical protein